MSEKTQSSTIQTLEERSKRAILRNAFMRWESAVILAGTAVGTYMVSLFNWSLPLDLPSWSILIAGGAGYVALVASSLRDEAQNAEIVKEIIDGDFNKRFDINTLREKKLRAYLTKAFDYRTRIQTQITELDDDAFRIQLEGVISQFDDWIEEIYDLAKKLDDYVVKRPYLRQQRDESIERRKKLDSRARRITDFSMLSDIEDSIKNIDQKIETIDSLHSTMQRAQLRLENTLTAMGTIYPQTLLLDAKDIDSSKYRRLQQDIQDEVDELGDVLHAMDDVYSDSL